MVQYIILLGMKAHYHDHLCGFHQSGSGSSHNTVTVARSNNQSNNSKKGKEGVMHFHKKNMYKACVVIAATILDQEIKRQPGCLKHAWFYKSKFFSASKKKFKI